MTPFKVILNEVDPARKLQVVSELARAFGLDEQVASDIASNVPIIIIDDISPSAVGTVRERLTSLAAAGAQLTTADHAPDDIPRVNWPEPPDIARVDEASSVVREPERPPAARMRPEDLLAVFACPDCGLRFEVGRAHGPVAGQSIEELSSYETLADESIPPFGERAAPESAAAVAAEAVEASPEPQSDEEASPESQSDELEPLKLRGPDAAPAPQDVPSASSDEPLPSLAPTESTDSWLNPPLALGPGAAEAPAEEAAPAQASDSGFSALKPLAEGPLERGRRERTEATESESSRSTGKPRSEAMPLELRPEDPISVLDTVPEMKIPESMGPPPKKAKSKRKAAKKKSQKAKSPPSFPEPLTPGGPGMPLDDLQPPSETEELPMLGVPDSDDGRSVVSPGGGAGKDLDNLYGMFDGADVESDSGGDAKAPPPGTSARRINTPANLSSDDFTEVAPIDFADIDRDLADLQSDDELLKSSALNPPDEKSDVFEPLDPDEAREIMQGGGNDVLPAPPASPTRPESGELEPLDPNEALELLNSGRHPKVADGSKKRGRKKRSRKKDGGGKLIPLSASDENFDFLETRDPDKPDEPPAASSRVQKSEDPDPFARAKRRTDPFVKARREKEEKEKEKERKARSKVSARTKAKTSARTQEEPSGEKSKRSDRKKRGSSRKTKEKAVASARAPAQPEKSGAGGDEDDIYGLVLSRIPTDAKRQKAADLISEIQGIGRRDALKLTDRTIIPVLKGVTKDRAEKHHKKFKKAGISARVTTRRIR